MTRTGTPDDPIAAIASGTVVGLQIVAEHRQPPTSVPQVRALVGYGLEGDRHGKKQAGSRRQLLIIDQVTAQALGLRFGDLREQITLDFPQLNTLPAGTLLRIGPATCELTGPCEPCTHIGQILGAPDVGAFQATLDGRRGQLAKITAVEHDGIIRLGDPVVLLGMRDPSSA